jgi:nitrile hydratase accessory protein
MTASPATVRAAAAALGAAAPPLVDGEPVFAEPWEGRAYGLALDLVEQRGLPWSAFRDRLIEAITEAPHRPYYESWVVALERLASDESLVSDDELTRERAEVAAYVFDEGGVDVEVVPLAHELGDLRERFGAVVSTDAHHVELFRSLGDDGGGPTSCGVRSYNAAGDMLSSMPIDPTNWESVRDELLSFGRPGR